MGILSSVSDPNDRWALRLGLGSVVLWLVTWGLLWFGRVNSVLEDEIFEPALVALQLGGISIATFVALYLRETEDRMRGAIAGAVVIPFMLLIIDLVTLPDFRESLTGAAGGAATAEADPEARLDFVQSMFDTFKWVVTAVVGFYFTTEAAEKIAEKVQTEKTARSVNEAIAEQAKARMAAGQQVPDETLLKPKEAAAGSATAHRRNSSGSAAQGSAGPGPK